MKVLDGKELRDIGTIGLLLERGYLRQLAMLLRELCRRRDLDQVGVAQRALGECGEPPQRLDFIAKQVDSDGAILGRGKQVEQTAPDCELAPVLDLVDALVSGCDQVPSGVVEVEQIARPQREAVGPERRVGHLLRQRHRADDNHRGVVRGGLVQQRVQRPALGGAG